MGFNKIQEIINIADERDIPFWQVVLEDDLQERNVSYEDSFGRMQRLFGLLSFYIGYDHS